MGEVNVLEVINLYRNYQRQSKDCINVLNGLSFQVKKGEFIGVMGKSGCGKTTLLKVLGLIDKQTGGTLKFMGQDTEGLHSNELADKRRKQIGFVFQDFYLMDSMSVKENIMLPMILDKAESRIMFERTRQLAKQFQIESLLDKEPCELSGGQKQRAAICRALVNNPDLVLADEPTGNLDTKSGRIVIDALTRINREYKKTVVMVTHDPKMASHCEKIIMIKDGVVLETLSKTGTEQALYQLILEKMNKL